MNKIVILLLTVLSISFCKKTEDIALLSAPIAYAIAKNAIKQEKPNGKYKINLNFSNIKYENEDWPSGEMNFEIESLEYPGQIFYIQYILNGSYNATAVVKTPQDKKQYNVNLYESTYILGKTKIIESYLSDLSNKLMDKTDKKFKMAVFDHKGINNEETILGRRISESLITNLVENNYKIVERKLLEPIYKEIKFQLSGATDDSSKDISQKIGKFLGADAVLIGTIKDEKEEIIINSRVVHLEQGLILSSGQVIIPKYLIASKDLNTIKGK
ncbi:MAG: curli production assembly/transport component CsgG domain protein [Leptospiraceae bacterium]|nr:curli production assembly/transport component CsgG domain protein [Leptospiraceae bacterium]